MNGPPIAATPAMRPVRLFGATILLGPPALPIAIPAIDWEADAAERAQAAQRLLVLGEAADRMTRRRVAQDQTDALGLPLADPAVAVPPEGG